MNKTKAWQVTTFAILWLAYASTYLLRKPLGLVKGDIQSDLKIPSASLGWLDTALLLPYAGVSIFFGGIGDKLGSRLTLGIGMIVAAIANAPIGACNTLYEILLLLFISGGGQALCWPASCSLLSKWFPDEIRSTIFGLYGSSCFIGGIGGTAVAVYLQTFYGWRGEFLIPSFIVASLGVIILLLGKEPSARNIVISSTEFKKSESESSVGLSFREVWKITLVPEVSIAMFCVKAIRYAMIMWLPLYLSRVQGYSKEMAGLASTSFEIGGMFGSLSIGIVVDKIFQGKPLLACAIASVTTGIALIGLIVTEALGPIAHLIWLAIAGAMNCGPDVILAGSVAAKIGEPHGATSAVAAVVNGMGSLGTVLEGPMVAIVAEWFGFNAMFPMMVLIALISAIVCQKAHLKQHSFYRYEVAPQNA